MAEELQTDLVVHRHGPPHGPRLVFLHGLTDSGQGWPGAVDHWSSTYSLLALDMRGHGESPRFTREHLDAHPGEVMVEDTIAVLEQLGESPVVIGHSLGGAVALVCAARRPDLVRGVVLEDPAPLGPDDAQVDKEKGRALAQGLRGSIEAKDDEALLAHRRAQHPSWDEAELRATGLAEQQMDTDYLEHGDFKPTTPWPELFEELIVPALVISGDAMDEVCIDADVEEGLERIGNPNVTLARVRDAGHCIRREQPEKFYDIVDAWLARH